MNHFKNVGQNIDPIIKMRVRRFYKDIMKELPGILKYYNLPIGLKEARYIIKSKFERNGELSDAYLINSQIKEGRKLLDETVNLWKTKKEVLEFFRKKPNNNNIHITEEEMKFINDFFKNS